MQGKLILTTQGTAADAIKLHYAVIGVIVLICLLTGYLGYQMYQFGRRMKEEHMARQLYESIEETLRTKTSVYERLERWLKSIGAEYAVKGFGDPFQFILINAVFAVGIMVLFSMLSDIWSGLLVTAALLGTEILMLTAIDQKHNKEMLDDISYLYDATAIQLGSSIYIVEAILNCLVYVRSKRLKNALKELCTNLTLGGDVRMATRDFSEKFRNAYLDTFCSVIVQITTETGEAGRLIEDMSKQLSVLKETSFAEKKKSTENKLQLCIIGIFIVFTVLIFWLCIASMTGSAGALF